MKINKDNRCDNVDKIQHNISNTIKNSELAKEAIKSTTDEKTKRDLKLKNERREESLDGMRKEIQEEAIDKNNDYK